MADNRGPRSVVLISAAVILLNGCSTSQPQRTDGLSPAVRISPSVDELKSPGRVIAKETAAFRGRFHDPRGEGRCDDIYTCIDGVYQMPLPQLPGGDLVVLDRTLAPGVSSEAVFFNTDGYGAAIVVIKAADEYVSRGDLLGTVKQLAQRQEPDLMRLLGRELFSSSDMSLNGVPGYCQRFYNQRFQLAFFPMVVSMNPPRGQIYSVALRYYVARGGHIIEVACVFPVAEAESVDQVEAAAEKAVESILAQIELKARR